MVKKFVKAIAFILIALVALAFAVPYFFKDKIIALVKTELNKSINATANFSDVNISFFRNFPRLSVGIENLSIVGKEVFIKDTLLSAKDIRFAVNLMSAIKQEEIQIYSINVINSRIKAHVLNNGKVNWDIVNVSDTSVSKKEEKSFKINLKNYEIENGYLVFLDDQNNTEFKVANLNHSGEGDFSNEVFKLETKTTSETIDLTYGGIHYINKVKALIDASFDVNNKTNTYSFATKDVWLNDLQLNTKGFVQMLPDGAYNLDVNFNTVSSSFKTLLSFIPVIYKNNFEKLETKGTAAFNGFAKGVYNNTSMPAYAINLEARNGYFKYPSLPTAVENIQLDAHLTNETGKNEDIALDIKQGHFEIEKDPFDFKLQVKQPLTNLWASVVAKGKLNLGKTASYLPLQKGTTVQGIVDADAMFEGLANDIQLKKFDKVKALGKIDVQNLFYKSNDYPQGLTVSNINALLTPQQINLNNINATINNTNIQGSGYINNFISYAFSSGTLNGLFNINVDKVFVNSWMSMAPPESSTTKEPLTAFIIPKNIDIALKTKTNYIEYDKLTIANALCDVHVANEAVEISNLKGNSMNGTFTANGSYSTLNNKQQPAIDFNYAVNNVDIKQAFEALNTFEKLLPIGKFLNGKLNSQFNMSGILGEDLMPQLTSLSGLGNLLMIDGVLNSFAPLEKLASTLKVNELKNISAKDVKAFIEFSNGKVMVKPFKLKVKGIDMEIGGLHGLNQDMDYTINMNIPRAMISDKGNALVNDLQTKANNLGANIVLADLIPVQVKMGGSIKNPIITTNLKTTGSNLANDLKNQIQTFAQAKIDVAKAQADSAKKALRDTIKSAKNVVINNAKNELIKQVLGSKDTTQKTGNPVEDTKKQLEQKGKGLIDKFNPFKKKQAVVTDTTKH